MASRGRGKRSKRGPHQRGAQAGQQSPIGQPTCEAVPSEPTQVEASSISSAGSCMSQKRGRGKTRGITHVRKRRTGEKPTVDIPPDLMRAVGNNAQALITELGIIVRQMAPLRFPKWKAIPNDDKMKMWQATKQTFTLQEEDHIQKAVYQQLNRQYRDYRHRLHKGYYNKYATDEMRLQNPPLGVSHDDWVDLVRYFGSEDFKKLSNRNKENREKQKINHIAGTKAFSRISYDSRDRKTGEEPSRTNMWFTTRFSQKKNVWVNPTSQEIYEELRRLESQPSQDGTASMTEDQRFEAVLGPERSGYIRGRGAGPKQKSFTTGQRIRAQLERENEEFRRQAESATRRMESLEREHNEMSSRLESLESQVASQQSQVQAQVQAALKSQLSTLLQLLKESGQIPTLQCDWANM